MRVPVAPYSYQHLMFLVFWILAILIGVYLIVLLISSFLMIYNIGYLFICLFATFLVAQMAKCLPI